MQDNQLRLSALCGKDLRRHLQQRFIFGVFIRFKVATFQELNLVSPFRDAGDGRIVFPNLALIREPPVWKPARFAVVITLS